jgi:multiple sugar transport system ATP-binding protein
MAEVTIRDLKKAYGAVSVIEKLDLDIPDGAFVVLVGPSGCGKSTLLRMIAGLEEISGGDIRIGDRRVNNLPPSERDIAMVFQNYALYPHKTVAANMGFPLKMKGEARDVIARKVTRASPWAGPSCAIRRSSSSTSRCRISTPSCASRCAPKFASCTCG